jgi:methionyl-tRNA formyltransferase
VSALKLVFFGSDPIAMPLLDWLAGAGRSTAEIVAVFTQPDRPMGRGQKITPNAVKIWAQQQGIPVHQPVKITAEVREVLGGLMPDVSLVMAYGHILKDDFIATPRLGTLNLHTSLLPKYRGASPIQSAIASGEETTGVTLMQIVRELDAGPVADVEKVKIGPLDTALDVETKLAAACVPLIARNLPRLAAGELTFGSQHHADATFCRKLIKTDGGLDFLRPATELAARINGLFPWPACALQIEDQLIKFGQADVTAGTGQPGVVAGHDETGLLIGTGSGLLRVRRLQKPGGRMLPAAEFLRGWPIAAGTELPSTAMSILVTGEPFRR